MYVIRTSLSYIHTSWLLRLKGRTAEKFGWGKVCIIHDCQTKADIIYLLAESIHLLNLPSQVGLHQHNLKYIIAFILGWHYACILG